MALKIKYPTLITSELDSHYYLYQQMVADVITLLDGYSRNAPDQKLEIKYRGKSKIKVINSINYTCYSIGQVPCIQLCVQEYKTGQEDLFLKRHGEANENAINTNDQLGSNQNYALLYPLIDQRAQPVNKWLIIIYVTPGKDDVDMVNTFKNIVNKIFHFPFRYVVPVHINHQTVIPKVEVTLSTIENVDNDQFIQHDFIINSSSRSTKKVEYANINAAVAEEILNYNDEVNSRTTRKIRFFHDLLNKSSYTTYTVSAEEDGVLNTVMTTKYSESDEIEPDQLDSLYDELTMRTRFSRILTNYLSNGVNGQIR